MPALRSFGVSPAVKTRRTSVTPVASMAWKMRYGAGRDAATVSLVTSASTVWPTVQPRPGHDRVRHRCGVAGLQRNLDPDPAQCLEHLRRTWDRYRWRGAVGLLEFGGKDLVHRLHVRGGIVRAHD